jgi:hypothetical protein
VEQELRKDGGRVRTLWQCKTEDRSFALAPAVAHFSAEQKQGYGDYAEKTKNIDVLLAPRPKRGQCLGWGS